MPPKKVIAAAVVSAALLLGLAAPGVAGASNATPPTVTGQAQGHQLHLGKWLIAHRLQIRRVVVSISAKAIGLSRQDMAVDLGSGQSIAEVAAAHHVATQAVVNALRRAADARITKAVSRHKLNSTEGNKVRQRLEALVQKLVHHQFRQTGTRASPPTQS